MPQTKFQDFIFGIMMVILMVFAMVTYNISLGNGGLSNEVFLEVLKALPLTCLIAFLIEFFFVGKIVHKITFKVLDVKQIKPIYQPPCTESAGFVVMTESHTMLKHTILSKNIINIIILIFYIFFYHILCYFSYTSTKISRRPHVLTPKLFS